MRQLAGGGGTPVDRARDVNVQLTRCEVSGGAGPPYPDDSGNGSDIALVQTGGMWTPDGPYGGALDLANPASAQPNPSAAINTIKNAITIAAFAFALPQPPGQFRALLSRNLNGSSWAFGLSDTGTLLFGVDGGHTAQSDATPPSGTWVHVAATYDGQTARIYLRGALVFESDIGAASLATAGGGSGYPPLIGATAATNQPFMSFFGGQIDELALYNRALTADEIAALAAGVFPSIDRK